MILIHIAVKFIRAALRYQLKLAAAAGACRRLAASHVGMKLLNRIHRSMSHDGAAKTLGDPGAGVALARPTSRKIVYIQTIDRDIVLVDACACHGAVVRHARLKRKQRGRIVALLHGKTIQRHYVERVADLRARRIDRYLGIRGRHLDRFCARANR